MKAEQLTDVQYHKLQDAKAIALSLSDDERLAIKDKAVMAFVGLNRLLEECEQYAKREEVAPPF